VVVAVDSDWDMLGLDIGAAGARAQRFESWRRRRRSRSGEPQIGRQLYRLFRAAGLDDVKVEIHAGADTAGRSLPMLKASFARYARDSGKDRRGRGRGLVRRYRSRRREWIVSVRIAAIRGTRNQEPGVLV